MFGGNYYIGNRGGIPVVNATPTVGTADVQISLPNNVFRFLGAKGIVVVELATAVPTGTTGTLPILAEVNGQTRPITNASGAGVTVTELGSTTTFVLFFDKPENKLQILSQTI